MPRSTDGIPPRAGPACAPPPMQTVRLERVRELVKRNLGEIIRREFSIQENGLLNVNEVEVSGDLKLATAYVGVVGSADQKKRAAETLQRERARIQGLLAHAIVLRHTPQLRLVLDESIEKGNQVLRLIEEIERQQTPE